LVRKLAVSNKTREEQVPLPLYTPYRIPIAAGPDGYSRFTVVGAGFDPAALALGTHPPPPGERVLRAGSSPSLIRLAGPDGYHVPMFFGMTAAEAPLHCCCPAIVFVEDAFPGSRRLSLPLPGGGAVVTVPSGRQVLRRRVLRPAGWAGVPPGTVEETRLMAAVGVEVWLGPLLRFRLRHYTDVNFLL
jgi:hypothetical protein